MDFTYKSYEELIKTLRENNYTMCGYNNHNYDKCAILRHDVDQSTDKASKLASIECNLGVKSTYFFLLSSDFYNIASKKNYEAIHRIKAMGHEIGLHFDEMKYNTQNLDTHYTYDIHGTRYIRNPHGKIVDLVEKEIRIMSDILGVEILTVSMHRPSNETLVADYRFEKAVNTYSKTFFEEFKYLSDSRFNWRESVMDIVKSNTYKKLHILTHAFWYEERSMSGCEIIKDFVNSANSERYNQMKDNIKNIDEFMTQEEVI